MIDKNVAAESEELETDVVEVDVSDDDDFEVEIEDDTPDADKGRSRRAADVEADIPEDEELEKHSESVQKRIKKLKFEFHEERRRKEEAEREREVAVQYAGAQRKESERLRKNLSEGEGVLVNEAKARVASEITSAKREYKEAYEAGDSDAVLEAQMKLSKLQFEEDRVQNWRPAKAAVEQQVEEPAPRAAPRVPKPDARAQEWASENEWFDKDNAMRRYAILVHEELLESGVAQIALRTWNPRFDNHNVRLAPWWPRVVEIPPHHAIKLSLPHQRPQSPSASDYPTRNTRRKS
jgi:hypothetical protein